jgi:CBS-domain-containing membrane protein
MQVQAKTLNKKVKKLKAGHVVVTSTVETVMTEEYINEQLELLEIHRQRAKESLDNIERQIAELNEIKKQLT